MNKILVVDDNKTLAKLFAKKIEAVLEFSLDVAFDISQVQEYIAKEKYILCLLDVHSFQAQEELVNLCFKNKIPSIILINDYNEKKYTHFWEKQVVDFIIKDDSCVEKIIESIADFCNYQKRKIILALCNNNERNEIKNFLNKKGFEILAAAHGEEVLNYLEFHPDVKMIICDTKMPVINAYDLLIHIRQKYNQSELGLIVLNDDNDAELKLLKQGANDVLNKPFSMELLSYKIMQNFKNMQNLELVNKYSNLDSISGLQNSQALMKELEKYFYHLKEYQEEFAFAFLDIDKLKTINEEYSYEIGNKVIKQCAKELISETKGRDIIGRYSPEKFCILLKNINNERAIKIFSHIRVNIKSTKVADLLDDLYFSVSIGLCFGNTQSSLKEMMQKAEKALFEAKNNGGDRVEVCF
ncbi:diguanylate cyclase [Campylobacter sp. US33a]|uniref:GGDEF domain-containing response regulator n=1 Tax=Campylobacter sp. US33a TaxID=2498120 RepID=UPI0010683A3F|nr:diguanylate cyclase [Campylobacter sp. US33a]MCW1360865.1 diguanylate cyclase [Campylobacter jejuni]TEY01173.1 response regulator [Campylobacter sp. US33a]